MNMEEEMEITDVQVTLKTANGKEFLLNLNTEEKKIIFSAIMNSLKEIDTIEVIHSIDK
jgi:phosphosulfolactate phosphohydrolase-like enzyme